MILDALRPGSLLRTNPVPLPLTRQQRAGPQAPARKLTTRVPVRQLAAPSSRGTGPKRA